MRQCLPNAQTFVIDEKECAVLDYGTAKGGAELVLLIRLPSQEVEGVSSIELIVTEELVDVPVKCIRSRLDDRIQDGTIAAAEFGTVGVRLNFEFAPRSSTRD